ncbi:MAG: branched-chain amino acid ABC transporter permease [Acidimicrobiia bacterium]|nr:branched-chain amino acid ABC transporter permease [bacterium]MXZ30667.1 branched-chain amino acid ABC transporter permease [Acidimicrobiia bacterium]MYB23932.1 branched-chain amino acid ABC transporter permease [Acidimicrobiia bacterium]MYJ13270.1 branched-chain amino acid ABC transporter permease [Acidimicrobiia bacterium]
MQHVIFGLTTGGVLAAATVGFALIRQTENILHIAHGQMLALGAFLAVILITDAGLNVFAAGVVSMLLMGVLGVALGIVVFKPVMDKGGNVLLFTSIGLAFVIYGAIIAIFGTILRPVPVGFGSRVEFSVPEFALVLVLAAVLAALVGWLLANRARRAEHREVIGTWAELWAARGTGLALAAAAVAAAVVFGLATRFDGFGAAHDSLDIATGELAMILLSVGAVLGLQFFLSLTRMGRWLRAAASNPDLAAVRGIPVRVVSSVVWFIGSALAAMAGVMIAVRRGGVTTPLGWENILVILSAAVLGGTGSIMGVMAAAVLLGMAMDVSALWIPTAYRLVVAFGALILVLLVRPEGLFSTRRRAEQAA